MLNKTQDIGLLLFNDATQITSETDLDSLSNSNINYAFQQLFTFQGQQPKPEVLEFDKPKYALEMPDQTTVIPRFRPLPSESYMTKWERFRLEKGMAPRKKRSRLIYDAITKDWVPRWGPWSIKKIQEASEYIIVEKKTDIPIEKQDLFEQR